MLRYQTNVTHSQWMQRLHHQKQIGPFRRWMVKAKQHSKTHRTFIAQVYRSTWCRQANTEQTWLSTLSLNKGTQGHTLRKFSLKTVTMVKTHNVSVMQAAPRDQIAATQTCHGNHSEPVTTATLQNGSTFITFLRRMSISSCWQRKTTTITVLSNISTLFPRAQLSQVIDSVLLKGENT